jgi:Xaa-Pro aminopeptidase
MSAATGLKRVLDAMARDDVDVLLLGREGNARYVSGTARLFLATERPFAPGCVVVRPTGAVHLLSVGVPAGWEADAVGRLYPITWNPGALVGGIAALPGVAGARRVGVDGMTPLFEQILGACFADATLVDGEALVRAARRVKTADELDAIRAAIAVAHDVMAAARGAARSGASERGVVAVAMEAMARAGVATASFEPVVRRVHGVTAIDVGVLRDGWEGGLARTEPDISAPGEHVAAIARCRAGARVRDVAPGGDVYGVGLGYEVLAPGDELEPGMVLSIATDTVRDLVLVTDGEPEVLTQVLRGAR